MLFPQLFRATPNCSAPMAILEFATVGWAEFLANRMRGVPVCTDFLSVPQG